MISLTNELGIKDHLVCVKRNYYRCPPGTPNPLYSCSKCECHCVRMPNFGKNKSKIFSPLFPERKNITSLEKN